MGFIHRWAQLASYAPYPLVALAHGPVSALLKAAGVVSGKREIPRFARRTFVDWFQKRRRDSFYDLRKQNPDVFSSGMPEGAKTAGFGPVFGEKKNPDTVFRVLLWPDTFNNYFHPETAIAAVEVLEAAGCTVTI